MEKEKLTSATNNSSEGAMSFRLSHIPTIVWHLITSLLLAIPLYGILVESSKVLAEVELGDPVELYKTNPWSMQFFRYAILSAIALSFTPFKMICSLATGLAIGGITFYSIDKYYDLQQLSEMGLSSKPITDMVILTSSGHWLIVWCVITITTQLLLGVINPISKHLFKKNR